MTSLLGSVLATNFTPGKQKPDLFKKADIFEKELSRLIIKKLDECPTACIRLCCNYDPEGILLEAAETADISPSVFPFKCNMTVSINTIMVSEGLYQPYVKLSED